MKRLLIFPLLCLLAVAGARAASFGTNTISILAEDADLDAAFALVARDASYAQLAATDSLELVLDQTTDTAVVRIRSVKSDSTRFDTVLTLNGTDTVRTGSKLLFYEGAEILRLSSATGTSDTAKVTILRATGGTHISQIDAGQGADYVGQRFVTPKELVTVLGWSPRVRAAGDTVYYEVRQYNDWLAARNPAIYPYTKIAELKVYGTDPPVYIPIPNVAPPTQRKLWLSIWGKGGAANSTGNVQLDLREVRQ